MQGTHKGRHFEQLGKNWLQQQGLLEVAQNFHCRGGEIDLIMRQGETLCFIEVKYRNSSGFGGAAYSIPRAKQRKIIQAALVFLQKNKPYRNQPYRFDALLITPAQSTKKEPRFDWIPGAFSGEDGRYF